VDTFTPWRQATLLSHFPTIGQDALLLRPQCADVTAIACMPLDSQYAHFLAAAERLLQASEAAAVGTGANASWAAPLSLQHPDFVIMHIMLSGSLGHMLLTARDILRDDAGPVLAVARVEVDVFLAAALGALVIAAGLLRSTLSEVRATLLVVRRMLRMAPRGVGLVHVEAYLRDGKLEDER